MASMSKAKQRSGAGETSPVNAGSQAASASSTKSASASSADSQKATKSTGVRVAVGVSMGVVLVVVVALITAFIWPGWASRLQGAQQQETVQPTVKRRTIVRPTTEATPLPAKASALLKAMPDAVGAYARKAVTESTNWQSAKPIEEHTITYSTGTASQNVTLVVAQWVKPEDAQTQYNSLAGKLSGSSVESGSVKVSGKVTGSYELHKSGSRGAVAVWQNSTCVFEVSGPMDAVRSFYTDFPL